MSRRSKWQLNCVRHLIVNCHQAFGSTPIVGESRRREKHFRRTVAFGAA
jgi:hypothetical protein